MLSPLHIAKHVALLQTDAPVGLLMHAVLALIYDEASFVCADGVVVSINMKDRPDDFRCTTVSVTPKDGKTADYDFGDTDDAKLSAARHFAYRVSLHGAPFDIQAALLGDEDYIEYLDEVNAPVSPYGRANQFAIDMAAFERLSVPEQAKPGPWEECVVCHFVHRHDSYRPKEAQKHLHWKPSNGEVVLPNGMVFHATVCLQCIPLAQALVLDALWNTLAPQPGTRHYVAGSKNAGLTEELILALRMSGSKAGINLDDAYEHAVASKFGPMCDLPRSNKG